MKVFKDGSFVVIEGNIGAGKTTLAEMLSLKFNARLVLESFAENTFLPQFYSDPVRYAFPLEMSFMAERFRQLSQLFNSDEKNKTIIADYYFGKCLLFSQINLSKEEFGLYSDFFNLLENRIPEPDLIIFLKKDIPQLRQNIEKRGRPYEKKIKDEYLIKINKAYDSLIASLKSKQIPTLEIDTNNLDFVNDARAFSHLLDRIKAVNNPVNNS